MTMFLPSNWSPEQVAEMVAARDPARINYTTGPPVGATPLCMQEFTGKRMVELGGVHAEARWWKHGDMPMPEDPVIGCDTETHLIEHNGHAPDLVLGQFYYPKSRLVHLVEWHQMHEYIELLDKVNPHSKLLWQNVPFDFYVLGGKNSKWLFRALIEGRIVDVGIRYLCNRIEGGHWNGDSMPWNLQLILRNLCGVYLPKDPDVRLGFRREKPLTEAQVIYSAMDPLANWLAYSAMPENGYPTETTQIRAFIAMGSLSRRGMLTDRPVWDAKLQQLQDEMRYAEEVLHIFGIYKGVSGKSQVLQEWLENIEARSGLDFPRTDKLFDKNGRKMKIKIKADKKLVTLFPDGHSHTLLKALKQHSHAEKYLGSFVNMKFLCPDDRIRTSYEPLVKTGRMSSRKPNRTNVPRDGGIRECSKAQDGYVYYACDYSQVELVALAQDSWWRFGQSSLREAINAGVYVHALMGAKAADVLGTPDMPKKAQKQAAKALNFGLPGGLGAKTWIEFAKMNYGVTDISVAQAKLLKKAWLELFPEMALHLKGLEDPEHFDENGKPMYIGNTMTGRRKPNSTYTSHLNLRFQGLAGDGAKNALWLLWLSDYPVGGFIHDEFVHEFRIDRFLQENISRATVLQIKGMQDVCPDVTVRVEGALMLNWSKGAKPVCTTDKTLLRLWTPDIEKVKEDNPLFKATDAEIVSATPVNTRPLWEIGTNHSTSFLGWQPLSSVPNAMFL